MQEIIRREKKNKLSEMIKGHKEYLNFLESLQMELNRLESQNKRLYETIEIMNDELKVYRKKAGLDCDFTLIKGE